MSTHTSRDNTRWLVSTLQHGHSPSQPSNASSPTDATKCTDSMCFQGFVHCSCGHDHLLEGECGLANGIPFYLKAACPDYVFQSVTTISLCGRGKFYCAATPEGRVFEKLHRARDETEGALTKLDARMQAIQSQAEHFPQAVDKNAAWDQLNQQRKFQHRMKEQVTTVIKAGSAYYQHQTRSSTGASSDIPPFKFTDDLKRDLLPELCQIFEDLERPRTEAGPSDTLTDIIDDNASPAPLVQTIKKPEVVVSDALKSSQSTKESPTKPAPSKLATLNKHSDFEREVVLAASNETNKAKETPKQTKPRRQISSVRRSTRVRNHVNYAESSGSLRSSPARSPPKSDNENFSPPKSDRTSSSPWKPAARSRPPTKGHLRESRKPTIAAVPRSTSTLGDKIEDWNRRSTWTSQPSHKKSLHFPGRQGASAYHTAMREASILATGTDFTSRGYAAWGDVSFAKHSAELASTHTNPAHRPSGMIQLSNPGSSRPYLARPTPDAKSNLYNQYAGRMLPPKRVHESRRDSAFEQSSSSERCKQWLMDTAMPAPETGVNSISSPHLPSDTDHDLELPAWKPSEPTGSRTKRPSVKKSFSEMTPMLSAPATLSGPATQYTDPPKKRALPASSPAPQPKRVHLSLPGQNDYNVYNHPNSLAYDPRVVSSSPLPTRAAQLPPSLQQQVWYPQALQSDYMAMGFAPTPAPFLTPRGIVYATPMRMGQSMSEYGLGVYPSQNGENTGGENALDEVWFGRGYAER